MRVPRSGGGGMLHAGGRVGGGGGCGERGERRRPDGRDGMVMMSAAGDGRTAAGHHERGAGCHGAAGLLERVAAVVLVMRQRW